MVFFGGYVVGVLSGSKNPTDYLKKMRKRDEQLAFYIGTNCPQVEMKSSNGKKRKILAGNMKDVFRIIQSIPSQKAEPMEKKEALKVRYVGVVLGLHRLFFCIRFDFCNYMEYVL